MQIPREAGYIPNVYLFIHARIGPEPFGVLGGRAADTTSLHTQENVLIAIDAGDPVIAV